MLAVVVAEGALPIDTEGTRTVFPDEDPAVAGAGAGFNRAHPPASLRSIAPPSPDLGEAVVCR